MKDRFSIFDYLNKAILILLLVSLLVTAITEVLLAKSIVPIVNRATGISNNNSAINDIVYYLLVALVFILSSYYTKYFSNELACQVERKLFDNAINELEHKNYSAIEEFSSGKIITIINSDIKGIKNYVLYYLSNLLIQPLIFIFSVCYMFYAQPVLSFIIMPLIISALIFTYIRSKKLESAKDKVQETLSEQVVMEKDAFAHLANIIESNDVDYITKKHSMLTDEYCNAQKEFSKLKAINYIPSLINEYVPTIFVIIIGSYFVKMNSLSYGQFAAFMQLMSYICLPMSKYSKTIIETRALNVYGKRYNSILQICNEKFGGILYQSNIKDQNFIEFKDVSFGYHNNNVIKNISFAIKRNEKICIVGESGVGKSTLIKLIMGFYSNYSGSIFLNSIEQRQYDINSYRSHMSYMDQNRYILPGSIAYNISSGIFKSIKGDEYNIKEAAKASAADDFINKLNNGYDTNILQSGKNLSGGELEKICLARSLYRDSELLILDEPTSAMDIDSEEDIVRKIRNKYNKTLIIVTHRINTIKMCDKVIFFNKNGELLQMEIADYLRFKQEYSNGEEQ